MDYDILAFTETHLDGFFSLSFSTCYAHIVLIFKSLLQVQCLPPVVVKERWSGRGVRAMTPNLQIYSFIYVFVYLFIYLYVLHVSFVSNLLAYILPCWLFCMLCFRGRAVANVGRTCSPTPLFVLIMYRGNKICLYLYNIF